MFNLRKYGFWGLAHRLHYSNLKKIVTAYDYPGMTKIANTNLSAINGLYASQFLPNLYKFAQSCKTRNETIPSHLQLVLQLFHHQNALRATELKTNPAYSLDPVLIAKILTFLSSDLSSKDKQLSILEDWKQKHKIKTGKAYPQKIENFLTLCIQAKKENLMPEQGYLTEIILLSFLHYKAQSRQDLLDYSVELNQAFSFPNEALLSSKLRFDEEDIDEGKQFFQQLIAETRNSNIDSIEKKIEVLTAFQFCKGLDKVPEVLQGTYASNTSPQTSAPSCFETALHNFFNKLLFDKKTQAFNLALLPSTLRLNEEFKRFYEQQTVFNLNSPALGRQFMNMLANNEAFIYVNPEKQFELETDPRNFLKVMRYILGCPVHSLEQLSELLSTTHRKITFVEKAAGIQIRMQHLLAPDELNPFEDMFLSFSPQHVYLQADYDSSKENNQKNKAALESLSQKIKNPMLLSLLYASTLACLPLNWSESMEGLRQRFIIFPPKTPDEAKEFSKKAFFFIDTHQKEIIDYLSYLNNTFSTEPNDAIKFIVNLLSSVESENHLDILLDLYMNHFSLNLKQESKEEILKNLLTFPNAYGNNVLYYISTAKTAQVLLNVGAYINSRNYNGETPLHYAKNVQIAQVLIQHCANVEAEDNAGYTPLHKARSSDIAALLIQQGAKVDARTSLGDTALHLAREPSTIETLIKAGADVNAKNNWGFAPINFSSSTQIIQLLIEAGANINTQNKEGKTPLHFAVAFEDKEQIRTLMQANANPNIQDNYGRTPLHYADTPEIASLLLLHAAVDLTIKDQWGQTAVDYYPYLAEHRLCTEQEQAGQNALRI